MWFQSERIDPEPTTEISRKLQELEATDTARSNS